MNQDARSVPDWTSLGAGYLVSEWTVVWRSPTIVHQAHGFIAPLVLSSQDYNWTWSAHDCSITNGKYCSLFQLPRDLRRRSALTRWPGLWPWILPITWVSASCGCWVLSGRVPYIGLITRPEESYWVRCVWTWSWRLDTEKALGH
jgi:hypothetical protein